MFYIGSNVADWPLEGMRALADGHEICVRQYPVSLPLRSLTSPQTRGPTVIVCPLPLVLLVPIHPLSSDRPHKRRGLCRILLQ